MPPPGPVPQRVGRYDVVRPIGHGGMGDVYLARDPTLERLVAIKVLVAALSTDSTMRARFMSEARAIAALNHPNIVTIHEIGLTGEADPDLPPSVPYLVMEHVDGESLFRILEARRLRMEEALSLAIQVVDGLRAAHQQRLIHRDIKPSNLMVTRDGRVKILDFGLSKLLRDNAESSEAALKLTAEGMIAGTAEYLSPEQALGKPVDARSDLFSFGIVLFEMLTGEHPFEGKSTTEKIANILTQPKRQWPSGVQVPATFKGIVDRALQKELDARYPSAEDLLVDLETARRELPSGAVSVPMLVPPLSQVLAVPKRRAWLAPTVLAGVLAVAVVGLLLARRVKPVPAAPPALKPVPLTTSAGLDVFPTFSPDGNTIAFASDRTGKFEIYARQMITGGSEVAVTADGGQNLQPAWSPDGMSLAYVSKDKGGVWVVPALGGVARRLTEFGSRPAWSADGAFLTFQSDGVSDLNAGAFPALPPSTLWIVPAAGGKPTPVTQPGVPPGGHGSPVFSPDGRKLLFVSYVRPRSELWTVNRDGTGATQVGKSLPFYFDPIYTPDGKAIYFGSAPPNSASGTGKGLWKLTLDADGKPQGDPVEVLSIGLASVRHLAFSKDGRRLAYSALTTSSNIWSAPVGGGSPTPLTTGIARNSRPAFSPDGSRIAFGSWRTYQNNDIWVMDADGGHARQLTTDPSSDDFPTWFPTGDRIAFLSTRRGPLGLFSIPAEGGVEKLLADLGPDAESGRLSPDATRIAYNSKKGGKTVNVWVSKADGTAARQLTFDEELMGFPCWSPDGKLLAVEMKRGDDFHIAVVPSEGGSPEQLTFAKGTDWPHSFFADGDRIVFAGQRDGYWNVWTVSRSTRKETRITSYQKINMYVRYPEVSPKGDRIVYEHAETTGNVWTAELPKP